MNKALRNAVIFTVILSFVPLTFKALCIKKGCKEQAGTDINLKSTFSHTACILNEKHGIRILSYNLLADCGGFSGTDAAKRAGNAEIILRACDADVICLQEISRDWLFCLCEMLDDSYRLIRPLSTAVFSKMNVIFCKRDKLITLKSGTAQFSHGDDTRTRFAVWAVFGNTKSGKSFAVINSHFNLLKNDSENESAQTIGIQTTELISLSNSLENECNCPVIAAGDFNSREKPAFTDTAFAYSLLTSHFKDSRAEAASVFIGGKKAFGATSPDHIFYSGAATAERFLFLTFENCENVSDHYAVVADFDL